MSAAKRASNSALPTANSSASACRMNGSKSPEAMASDNFTRSTSSLPHDHIIDAGIERAVRTLQAAGIETFESCEGGDGHAFPEPTVRFHGGQLEGFRALAAAMEAGLSVTALRRAWAIIDNEATGPDWELTFVSSLPAEACFPRLR